MCRQKKNLPTTMNYQGSMIIHKDKGKFLETKPKVIKYCGLNGREFKIVATKKPHETQ